MQFTPSQQQAITSTSSVIVTIAGAGSGKTSTVIARIKHVISNGGVAPSEIIVITFTNAAARELVERLGEAGKLLGYVGTLHGYMLRIIRQHGATIGLRQDVAIIDEAQRNELLDDACKQVKYTGSQKALKAALGEMDLKKPINNRDKAQLAANAYWQLATRHLLVDYDMMLYWGLRILQEGKPKLTCKHLFVDEIQDSGDKDFAIYNALDVKTRFYVGDTDQAIYQFRGGRVSHIMELIRKPGVEVFTLSQNFRCPVRVCDAANKLISHNKNRVPKDTLSATGSEGYVHVWRNFATPVEEVGRIAEDIKHCGSTSVAVLCATNRTVDQVTTFLESRGVNLAKKKFDDYPDDWPKARLLLQIGASVDNDYLVGRYLALYSGKAYNQIVAMKTTAAQKRGTLNSVYNLFEPLESVQRDIILQYLDRHDVGYAARELVERHLDSLTNSATIADLLYAVGQEIYHKDEESEGVIVTTYHAFKGRERDIVYLPAFEAQFMPGKRAETQEEIEERRRVGYVAVTRARDRLVISYAMAREPHEHTNKLEPVLPSPYIAEMGL